MRSPSPLVLSLYPNWNGLGFVVFEKPLTPYDWGVKERRGKEKNRALLAVVRKLLEIYSPSLVVLEDWTERNVPRSKRIVELYERIVELCMSMDAPVTWVPMREVRQVFAAYGAKTKCEIAQLIAERIPAFKGPVPERKPWQPEHPRQALFDAVALGLTYSQRTQV